MALIAKTFKADLDTQKGHLQSQDLGALFAFTYPQKAGILNITGTDCSYNGYPVIVGNTAQLTFNKGYIVIFGRAIYVEQNTQVAFNMPTSGTVNGVLGVKVNLAENGANEVTWFQKTTTPQTDNLLSKDANGIYEFVLYSYSATPTTFTLGEKTTEIINQDWLTKYATVDYVTELVESAKNIDEGNIVDTGGNVVGKVFRQLNFVYGYSNEIDLPNVLSSRSKVFKVDTKFAPKTTKAIGLTGNIKVGASAPSEVSCVIEPNGDITLYADSTSSARGVTMVLGYEITGE